MRPALVVSHDPAPTRPAAPAAAPQLSDWATDLLNHLRMVALGCRAAPHADLFHACAVLSLDRSAARSAHAEVLMRCLAQALGQRPKLYRPGVTEVSFDEAWLARAAEAALNDPQSFEFLIRSRLPRQSQRNLAFLIRAVAEAFRRI